jgi:hypothetical protein
MNEEGLREEINKRFTLNWLIQGAAQHAGMTFHHLIRDQLNAIEPKLVRLYDQYALINLLQYWQPDGVLLIGWPPFFWWRAAHSRLHPFFAHPLLSRFGGLLAKESRRRARERCKEKRLTAIPFLFSFQGLYVMLRLFSLEVRHQRQLVELARETASTVWGIPSDRLDAALVFRNLGAHLGDQIPVRSIRGAVFRSAVCGFGSVECRGDRLIVVSRGTNWQLVAKELVKGTAELICLYGLNTLDEETYTAVVNAADRIEYEPWMLQTGGELWRRLLAVLPPGVPLAVALMRLARLPAKPLQDLIAAVIERPQSARLLLDELFQDIERSGVEFGAEAANP